MKFKIFSLALVSCFSIAAFAGSQKAYIADNTTGSEKIESAVTALGYQIVDRQSDADISISTEFNRSCDDSTPCCISIQVSGSQNFTVAAGKDFYGQLMFSQIGCRKLVVKKAVSELYQKLQRVSP